MRDYNIVTKIKSQLEEKGWLVEFNHKTNDWILCKFAPCGKEMSITLDNDCVLEDLENILDDWDDSDFIDETANNMKRCGMHPDYRKMLYTLDWFHEEVTDLYNSIKTLEGFSDDDTRGESKEEDHGPSDEA